MIKELTCDEIMAVSGGLDAMDAAIAWGSAITGGAIGLTVGGPIAGIGGSLIGFGMGLIGSYGYDSATGPGGLYVDTGYSCEMPS